jgi:release factor glutamine methyltransferase
MRSVVLHVWAAGRALSTLSAKSSYVAAFQTFPITNRSGWSFHRRQMARFTLSSHANTLVDAKQIKQALSASETVYETLVTSVALLEENSAPEPTASVCHLLSFALKDEFSWEDNGFAQLLKIYDSKSYNAALSDKVLTRQELDFFVKMLERRIAKEPLQYIIGQWDFHDCVLKVRSPCLCPRPETEELVEYAASDIRRMIQSLRANDDARRIRILDVGCGTGAIGLSIAKMFPNDVDVFAIDVSEAAIDLSSENSKFVLGDNQSQYHEPALCSAAEYSNDKRQDMDNNFVFKYDLIVSNPPYIPSKDMEGLTNDVIDFEDHRALCGGDDGLDVVRDILLRLPEWCEREVHRDFNPICWMEVDTSHPILIQKCAEKEEQVNFIEALQDFGGLDRFVKLEVKL